MSYDDLDLDAIMAEYEKSPPKAAPQSDAGGVSDETMVYRAPAGKAYGEDNEEYEDEYEDEPEEKTGGLFARIRKRNADPDDDYFDEEYEDEEPVKKPGLFSRRKKNEPEEYDEEYEDEEPVKKPGLFSGRKEKKAEVQDEYDEGHEEEAPQPAFEPLPVGKRVLLNLLFLGLLCLELLWSLNNLHPMGAVAQPRATAAPVCPRIRRRPK